MKKTGEILRQTRESKGLSVNEIALSLKINSKTLSAIEEGDTAKLPAKTFLRGFVQSYAHYLKMNVDEVMTVFAEEMGSTKPQVPVETKPEMPAATPSGETASASPAPKKPAPVKIDLVTTPSTQRPSAIRNKKKFEGIEKGSKTKAILLSAFCAILVVLIFTTKKVVDRYQKESVPAAVEVTAPLETEVVQAPEAVTVPDVAGTPVETVPSAAAAPTPVLNPAATAAPVAPPRTEQQTTQVSTQTPTPAPAPAPVEKPVEKPAEKVAEKKEEKPPEKKPGRPLELIIEAMDSVEIEYSTLAGQPKKMKLGADQVHTIRSPQGLKISVSNGGAVNLILNGRDLGVPGDLGKPVQLTY